MVPKIEDQFGGRSERHSLNRGVQYFSENASNIPHPIACFPFSGHVEYLDYGSLYNRRKEI